MSRPDTVIFDVDGVLWAAQDAYNQCTLFVARTLAREHGWPEAGLSLEHILAFKQSGGFNSDWDMVWALAVLLQARAEGQISPETSWAELAAENAGRGIEWVRSYATPETIDYRELQRLYDAYYWGADRYPQIYDQEPVVRYHPGFAHVERPYARPDLAKRLREAGVSRIGIITGRNRNEMRPPLATLNFDGLLRQDAIFTDEDGHKPDPDLLVRALARLDASAAVMVGDSIDDLRLVLNYRRLDAPQVQAQVWFVAIDHHDNPERWLRQGADAVLSDVNELPDWLSHFQRQTTARTADPQDPSP